MELLGELAKVGGPWPILLAIALLAVFLLARELHKAHGREVSQAKENASDRIADHGRISESASALKASMDAMNINLEHRNAMTGAMVESQRAMTGAIEANAEASRELVRKFTLFTERTDEDRRQFRLMLERIEACVSDIQRQRS